MLNSAHSVGRSLALPKFDPVARNGWFIRATPQPIYPRERPATHCKGHRVSLRDGLDASGKFRSPPEFETRSTQPVAGRYTDNDAPVISMQVYPRGSHFTESGSICLIRPINGFLLSFVLTA